MKIVPSRRLHFIERSIFYEIGMVVNSHIMEICYFAFEIEHIVQESSRVVKAYNSPSIRSFVGLTSTNVADKPAKKCFCD